MSRLIVRAFILVCLLPLGACHSRLIPGASSSDPEPHLTTPEITGIVEESHEILNIDSLQKLGNTLVVEVEGKRLNKYEFLYKPTLNTCQFRDVVEILPDGRITWNYPRTPAAFAGQHFKMYFVEEN